MRHIGGPSQVGARLWCQGSRQFSWSATANPKAYFHACSKYLPIQKSRLIHIPRTAHVLCFQACGTLVTATNVGQTSLLH
jgi:hypothetical protein